MIDKEKLKEAVEKVKRLVNTRIECEGCITEWSKALIIITDLASSVLEGKLVEAVSVEEIEETVSNIYGIGEPYLRQIAQAIHNRLGK